MCKLQNFGSILSSRSTVTAVPVPVNDFSGTNVTVPSGLLCRYQRHLLS